MSKIFLEYKTLQGESLRATFLPEQGMNLISFKKNDLEVIDQSTWNLFEERYAGLGALIGPHFHRRKPEIISPIKEENLFPHIAKVRGKGIQDPFSHGIARYAPWKTQSTKTQIEARLSGKDTWNGIPLSVLEGQNFRMLLDIELKENGLFLKFSVVSENDSLVGIHYYYALAEGKGRVTGKIQNRAIIQGEIKTIPFNWAMDSKQCLSFDLIDEADFTFWPYPDPLKGNILLETKDYQLHTQYESASAENCWQLYHPQGSTFVCIEPISAKDPRHPNLTVSSLKIQLEILSKTKYE